MPREWREKEARKIDNAMREIGKEWEEIGEERQNV